MFHPKVWDPNYQTSQTKTIYKKQLLSFLFRFLWFFKDFSGLASRVQDPRNPAPWAAGICAPSQWGPAGFPGPRVWAPLYDMNQIEKEMPRLFISKCPRSQDLGQFLRKGIKLKKQNIESEPSSRHGHQIEKGGPRICKIPPDIIIGASVVNVGAFFFILRKPPYVK